MASAAHSVPAAAPGAPNSLDREVAERGFAVVEGVVPPSLCDLLGDAVDRLSVDQTVRARRRRTFAVRNALEVLPEARTLADSVSIRELARRFLPGPPRIVRAILFDKNPEANWKVPWHQDTTIALRARIETPGFGPWSIKAGVVHVQPPEDVLAGLITLRIHLDDCGADNGPLVVLPGSHARGILSDDEIAQFKDRQSPVLCTGQRGSVVIMRPLLLHASSSAVAPSRRRILHLEFAGAELPGGLQWPAHEGVRPG